MTNKLILPFVLLGVSTAAKNSLFVPLHMGRGLTSTLSNHKDGRSLATRCDAMEDFAEDIMKDYYGFGFTCNCNAYQNSTSATSPPSLMVVSCDSKGIECCGTVCGTAHHKFQFDSNIDMTSESSCVAYTSGAGLLTGKRHCYAITYPEEQCLSTIDDEECLACYDCGVLPGGPEDVEFSTADCTNIPGGEVISATCDLEVDDEYWGYALLCDGAVASKSRTLTLSTVAAILAMTIYWD